MNCYLCRVTFSVDGLEYEVVTKARETLRTHGVEFVCNHRLDVVIGPPIRKEWLPAIALLSLQGITFKVEDIADQYRIGTTTAPKAYDGFGTLNLEPGVATETDLGVVEKVRIIAIPKDHYEWQTARFYSGLYTFVPLEEEG